LFALVKPKPEIGTPVVAFRCCVANGLFDVGVDRFTWKRRRSRISNMRPMLADSEAWRR
jgi:hypothetical protein